MFAHAIPPRSRCAYGAAVRVKRERFSTVTNRRTLTFDVLESRRLLAVDASLSAAVAPDAEGEDLSSEAPQASNSYQVIRSFGGGSDNGATPAASLTLVGTTIYGTTEGGGSSAFGTLFSMNQDGSNFQVLHSFAGGGIDGAYPSAGVVLVGSVLYGTTSAGGTANNGTVFSIDTDGSNYQIMHSFAANASDGSSPLSDLTVIGPTLYGTTQLGGGTHSAGTIFSINADGSNFQVLHSFSFPDGQEPDAGLTLVGSTLYGTTHSGGSSNDGTSFSVSVDGSSFHVLHSFSGPDGSNPASALTVVGSALYGTAESGAVFSISTTGSNYHVLHSFSIGPGGQDPHAGLTLVGSTLYGATVLGGSAGKGTVFSINPDGSNFQVQHSFTDADGAAPYASLILVGASLYGTTAQGNAANVGEVFSMDLGTSTISVLHTFSAGGYATSPAAVTAAGSTLYAVSDGGAYGRGALFSMNPDGTNMEVLHDFGAAPTTAPFRYRL